MLTSLADDMVGSGISNGGENDLHAALNDVPDVVNRCAHVNGVHARGETGSGAWRAVQGRLAGRGGVGVDCNLCHVVTARRRWMQPFVIAAPTRKQKVFSLAISSINLNNIHQNVATVALVYFS